MRLGVGKRLYRRMGLKGRPINLIAEGFRGQKSKVPGAKMYQAVVSKADGSSEAIDFYGVE